MDSRFKFDVSGSENTLNCLVRTCLRKGCQKCPILCNCIPKSIHVWSMLSHWWDYMSKHKSTFMLSINFHCPRPHCDETYIFRKVAQASFVPGPSKSTKSLSCVVSKKGSVFASVATKIKRQRQWTKAWAAPSIDCNILVAKSARLEINVDASVSERCGKEAWSPCKQRHRKPPRGGARGPLARFRYISIEHVVNITPSWHWERDFLTFPLDVDYVWLSGFHQRWKI